MNWFLKPIRERYPVNVEHKTIAGIYTDIVTPKDGVAAKNRNRVLLNVHGGGFVSGARTAALVESIPVASVEKIKVITIDYRMGPEYKFPAASEDVAAVYKEILKEYSPQHIGLYGCSAGGMLAAMSIAWFHKNHLPNPSAIGVLCASIGDLGGGDASFITGPLNGFVDSGRARRLRWSGAVSSGIFEQRRSQGTTGLSHQFARAGREISTHAARDEHPRNGIQFRDQFPQRIGAGGSRRRTACVGWTAARVLVQLRPARIPRSVRCDCALLRPALRQIRP